MGELGGGRGSPPLLAAVVAKKDGSSGKVGSSTDGEEGCSAPCGREVRNKLKEILAQSKKDEWKIVKGNIQNLISQFDEDEEGCLQEEDPSSCVPIEEDTHGGSRPIGEGAETHKLGEMQEEEAMEILPSHNGESHMMDNVANAGSVLSHREGPSSPIEGIFNFQNKPAKSKLKSRTLSERDELMGLIPKPSSSRLLSGMRNSSTLPLMNLGRSNTGHKEIMQFGAITKEKGDQISGGAVFRTPTVRHNVPSKGESQSTSQHPLVQGQSSVWKRPEHFKVDLSHFGDLPTYKGSLKVDVNAVNANQEKLSKALVGRIVGKRLPLAVLRSELQKKWAQFGEFQVVTISADSFICIFSSEEARDLVLMGGPWHLLGCIMGLDKWSPEFSANSFKGLEAPVWIRFPELPLLYWDNHNLVRMAACIGTPMWIDRQTCNWGNSTYARVCVKIKLDQKLLPGIWIDGVKGHFYQPIEYEGISQLCFQCGFIGHNANQCSTRHSVTSQPVATPKGGNASKAVNDCHPPSPLPSTAPLVGDSAPSSSISTDAVPTIAPPSVPQDSKGKSVIADPVDNFGPWTLVTSKKDKRQGRRSVGAGATVPTKSSAQAKGVIPRSTSILTEQQGTPSTAISTEQQSGHTLAISIDSQHTSIRPALESQIPKYTSQPNSRSGDPNYVLGLKSSKKASKAHHSKKKTELHDAKLTSPFSEEFSEKKRRKEDVLKISGGDASPLVANV